MSKLLLLKNKKNNRSKKILIDPMPSNENTSLQKNYKIQYRFDLGAKYFYIKCFLKKINTMFHKELYHQHMITFNNCIEKNSTKNNIEHFYREFDNLIENMKNHGFNNNYPIPIGNNGIIINGAHRLITSKYLNIEPITKIQDKIGSLEYDYNFFIKRNKYSSQFKNLSSKYSDFIALNNLELLKDTNNVRAIIIYPISNKLNKTNQIEKILKNNGRIMYKKEIKLSEQGIKNLIIELYRGETWIGGTFPKNDNNGKFKNCYADFPIIYYMYYFNNEKEDLIIKEKIRNLFNLKKDSVHITDHYNDTFRVSSSLLNENSIKFLNYGTNIISEKSKNLLIQYFKKVNQDENYIITSSVLLELFGLREAKDIDYIHLNDNKLSLSNISPHTGKWLDYYPQNKDDIIYNPNNYFYINGHKFVSLDIIKLMKQNRNENKDVNDIKLINSISN